MIAHEPDVQTVARSAVSSQELHRALCGDGGFTIDHDTGQFLRHGVAVCADPREAWSFTLDEWRDDRVSSWIAAQRSRLAQGDVHLGGWLQGDVGRVWLELVWVLPSRLRPAALAIATLHGQQAVYDLGTRQLVLVDMALHGAA